MVGSELRIFGCKAQLHAYRFDAWFTMEKTKFLCRKCSCSKINAFCLDLLSLLDNVAFCACVCMLSIANMKKNFECGIGISFKNHM